MHNTLYPLSRRNPQSMRFESNKDLTREKKAITKFVERFKGSFKKLDPNDVDYRVYDADGKLIAYAEVKGRLRPLNNAYPLPIAARKIVKLCDKRLNPVVIWACEDGVIYGKPTHLIGDIRWGGRKPREGAVNDVELMVYYNKQEEFRYIKYH